MAFAHLQKAVDTKYSNLDQILPDGEFMRLTNDPRWKGIISPTKANRPHKEKSLNSDLIRLLDTIWYYDQGNRRKLDSVLRIHGPQSEEAADLWQSIKIRDSLNTLIIKNIVAKYGWVGTQQVDEKGSTTLFLVIQHSYSATQTAFLPIPR